MRLCRTDRGKLQAHCAARARRFLTFTVIMQKRGAWPDCTISGGHGSEKAELASIPYEILTWLEPSAGGFIASMINDVEGVAASMSITGGRN